MSGKLDINKNIYKIKYTPLILCHTVQVRIIYDNNTTYRYCFYL